MSLFVCLPCECGDHGNCSRDCECRCCSPEEELQDQYDAERLSGLLSDAYGRSVVYLPLHQHGKEKR
jgi:hypothetical protein